MSHRVVNATDMTDLTLLKLATQQLGWASESQPMALHFNSGPLARTTLLTRTGELSFDSDHRSRIEQGLDQLRPAYARQKVLAEFALKGIMVEREDVDEKGNLRLYACSV